MENTGQVVLLVTTILGFAATAWREHIARKRTVEDRNWEIRQITEKAEADAKALLIETKAVAEALRIKALAIAKDVAAEIKADNKVSTDRLEEKILGAKRAAENAFQEANHAKVKLEITTEQIKQLNERLLEQTEKPPC
jgi:cell division protein FtsL